MMTSPIPVSREMLGMNSASRGLQGMISPVPEIDNAMDRGGASKVAVNTQPFNNQRFQEQNILQNTLSAAPQAATNAAGQIRTQNAAMTDQEAKAQQFASSRMSEALYANQSGTALMRLNAVMQSPERSKFLNDIATGKAMAQGLNPDLGQEVAQARQYG